MMTSYTAYGLHIVSELPLPELLPGAAGTPDVSIRFGLVSTKLPGLCGSVGPLQTVARPCVLSVLHVATYLVLNGQEIWIEPAANSTEAEVRLFLLGSALGALLHQRHLLPMHASAIQTTQGAVLFVGPSGHGKSTLLAAFLQRGYAMLADDVSAIALDTAGAIAFPAFPHIRLCADTATKLQQPIEGLRRVRASLDKYLLPVAHFCSTALPVRAVYALMVHQGQNIRLEPLGNLQRFAVLAENTYRNEFLGALGLRQAHFQCVTAMANTVPVYRLSRPVHPFLLDDLVRRVEAELT